MLNQGRIMAMVPRRKSSRKKLPEQLSNLAELVDQPIRDCIDKQLGGIWPASVNKFQKLRGGGKNYQKHKEHPSLRINEVEDNLLAAIDRKHSMKWIRQIVARELYYQGYTIGEIAGILRVSRYTISRDLGTYQGRRKRSES